MRSTLVTKLALVAATLLTPVQGHTWVDLIRNIASNGSFTGDPGYARGWLPRSPTFSDLSQTWQVENNHGSNPNLCAPTQQDASSQGSNPRLQATPGSPIALLYQENGHVTLPLINPAKPANRGTVYIYATQQPKAGEKYYDVYQKWNVAGNGGDGRGKLISTQNFDDGRCFQINGGPISQARQAANKFAPSNPMGGDVWCQNNIVIPHDADTSKLLTLYWVWKWDDLPGVDPKLPNGQNQTYTSCMDIALTPPSGGKAVRKFAYNGDQSPQNAALGNVFNKLATGNIFAVSAYIDGMSPTPIGAPSSVTYSIVMASATASAMQASTSAATSGCNNVVTSTETIFVYGTSTGTVAPTGTGLSFSTETGSTVATSASQTSQAQVPQTSATLASCTGVLVTQISDGQPQAPAATSGIPSVCQISVGQSQASQTPPATVSTQTAAGTSQTVINTSAVSTLSTATGSQDTTSASATTQSASSTSTSASVAAATSTISDNPIVVPVPTNPTASFTFEPSVTQTVSPITLSSTPSSSGATVSTISAVTTGTTSQASSAAATSVASGTTASSSASSSTGPCKAASAKKRSKIFAPVKFEEERFIRAVSDSVDRAHARHWR